MNFRPYLLLALLALTACGTQYRDTSQPIVAKQDFDAARYLGTWYEIARFPVPFQTGCTATTATYGAVDEDTISVLNACRQDTPQGPLKQIKGTADIVGPGKLKVQFNGIPFVKGDYWVLFVDNSYETAVVGVPNGKAGWILARSPQITDEKRADTEEVLRGAGYDVSQLIDVPHAGTGR